MGRPGVPHEDEGFPMGAVRAVLNAADPALAVDRAWPLVEDVINPGSAVALLSVGKASVPMARAAQKQLAAMGVMPAQGLVVAVPGQAEQADDPRWEIMVGDHPLATQRNLDAAARVGAFARGLDERWTVLCLISGGGSAHLASPAEGVTLGDLVDVTDQLLRRGATINELNCVRKHAETLKGGRLAELLAPATVVSLVLSDVLGDPLDVIASGPLSSDPTTFSQAAAVLDRYAIAHNAVRERIERGVARQIDETPKPGADCFRRVHQHVIANNQLAVDSAADYLKSAGYELVDRQHGVRGEACAVGRVWGQRAVGLQPGQAIVAGGECTVRVGDAEGLGGRCQELALAAAIAIRGSDALIAAFGTDGRDGPTQAAGAWADGRTAGLPGAARSLRAHDSHMFFATADAEGVGGLIVTGPTGTNVNDVWLVVRPHPGPR